MDKNKDNKEKLKKIDILNNFKTEEGEDATKYGEFVCSYFAWVPLEEQKEKVKKLQNITEDKWDMSIRLYNKTKEW